MSKKIFFILLFFILGASQVYPASPLPLQTQTIKAIAPIRKNDRILILAPHPDDETIGCAGIIQQALQAGAKVKIAYLTNGDHNEIAFIIYEKRPALFQGAFIHMGQERRKESIKAMKLLGLNENDLIFLGYPDFGTFAMFSLYWQSKRPFRDLLTRISSIPYKESFSFGKVYKPENILEDLKKVLIDYKPNKIFVTHPADQNVDHKSFYLFLQIALRDLNKEIPKPQVFSYLIHCVGWPLPRHYHPELSLMPPKQFLGSQANWMKFDLTAEQLNKKYQSILCYRSQTRSSAFYLLSFARKNELFGDYPKINLRRQVSMKERLVSFFGASDMFADSDIGVSGGLENSNQSKGQVSYAVVGNSILIHIEKSKELSRRFGLQLFLFGYSDKTPFAAMPKIRIITKYKRFRVFDGRKMIRPEGVSLEINSKILILKVPLQILGNPQFILTSIKAFGGNLPIDAAGFRRIEIN